MGLVTKWAYIQGKLKGRRTLSEGRSEGEREGARERGKERGSE